MSGPRVWCCVSCTRLMASSRQYRRLGVRRHTGSDVCDVCYVRGRYREQNPPGPRAPRRATADVLKEWQRLQATGLSQAEAAKVLGMRPATLRKAVQRATRKTAG